MSKDIKDVKLIDLLPDSISGDEGVQAVAGSIDPQLQAVSDALNAPLVLPALGDLATGILDHLAAQYDVTAWDTAWDKAQKIAVLRAAIQDKRKKGTRNAVQRAIEAIAPIAQISEWWEQTPEGAPHTFRVDVMQDGEVVPAQTQSDVLAQIEEAKPVRSHLEAFTIGQKAGAGIYMSGIARAISYARVTSTGTVEETGSIRAGIAAYARAFNVRRLVTEGIMGKLPEPSAPTSKAFGRSRDFQRATIAVRNYGTTPLYPEGDTGFVSSDSQVPVSIVAVYGAGDAKVSAAGVRVYWDQRGSVYNLRLTNGSGTVVTFRYLEYKEDYTRAFALSGTGQATISSVNGVRPLYAAGCSSYIQTKAGDTFEIIAAYDAKDNEIVVPDSVALVSAELGSSGYALKLQTNGAFQFCYVVFRKTN